MKITVVGTGYVGLVSGTCLAEVGHDVTCIDIDEKKIENLKKAISPIYESGLEGLIRRNLDYDRLKFSTDLKSALPESEMVFIAVGTPEGEDGSADLRYVEQVAKSVAECSEHEQLVVVKSTVPVGTCDHVEEIMTKILTERKVPYRHHVASNPEFLKEGKAVDDFMKPDRIIVGVTSQSDADLFARLYRPFITDDPSKLQVMDRRSSELSKYASNAMLATRISFMNEISRLCEAVGANVDNVRRGMGADPRIGRKFLYAGPGYGGSCFPKDVSALVKTGEKYDAALTVLQAVQDTNQIQKERVAERIIKHFDGDLKGKSVAVWGLAFKPGTDDVRETPSLTIIEKLLEKGAKINAHDPKAVDTFQREIGQKGTDINYCQNPFDCLEGADALVLVTEWSEYKWPNWIKASELMKDKTIFDFRNQWEGPNLKSMGFKYYCVGRPLLD